MSEVVAPQMPSEQSAPLNGLSSSGSIPSKGNNRPAQLLVFKAAQKDGSDTAPGIMGNIEGRKLRNRKRPAPGSEAQSNGDAMEQSLLKDSKSDSPEEGTQSGQPPQKRRGRPVAPTTKKKPSEEEGLEEKNQRAVSASYGGKRRLSDAKKERGGTEKGGNKEEPTQKVTPRQRPLQQKEAQGVDRHGPESPASPVSERWRTHQMMEDYVNLVGGLMYPRITFGSYGYNLAKESHMSGHAQKPLLSISGQIPLERPNTLGILLCPARRRPVIEKWNPYEIACFEGALTMFGKNFCEIQKIIKSKSTKEVIEFYYLWKTTSHYHQWKSSFEALDPHPFAVQPGDEDSGGEEEEPDDEEYKEGERD